MYLVEIYVEKSVCYWVELELLDDCCVLLTLDVDSNEVDVRSVNNLTEFSELYLERCCYWKVVLVACLTIEVTRNETFFS